MPVTRIDQRNILRQLLMLGLYSGLCTVDGVPWISGLETATSISVSVGKGLISAAAQIVIDFTSQQPISLVVAARKSMGDLLLSLANFFDVEMQFEEYVEDLASASVGDFTETFVEAFQGIDDAKSLIAVLSGLDNDLRNVALIISPALKLALIKSPGILEGNQGIRDLAEYIDKYGIYKNNRLLQNIALKRTIAFKGIFFGTQIILALGVSLEKRDMNYFVDRYEIDSDIKILEVCKVWTVKLGGSFTEGDEPEFESALYKGRSDFKEWFRHKLEINAVYEKFRTFESDCRNGTGTFSLQADLQTDMTRLIAKNGGDARIKVFIDGDLVDYKLSSLCFAWQRFDAE